MVKAWNKVMTDERKALVKAKWTAFLQVIRKLCAKVKALVKKAAHAVYGVWKKIMSEKNKQAVKAKVSAMKQAVVHAAKIIKQKTVTKIKGLKTKETAEGLRTYKLFYISDYEKEASYCLLYTSQYLCCKKFFLHRSTYHRWISTQTRCINYHSTVISEDIMKNECLDCILFRDLVEKFLFQYCKKLSVRELLWQ